MAIEIRRVRPEEYEEAGEVTALAYREFGPDGDEDWESYFRRVADVAGRDAVAAVFVALDDGEIIGSVTLELDERVGSRLPAANERLGPDQAHIRMLGVRPAARRGGTGKALMRYAIEEARAAGKSRLTLHTSTRMEAAQGMYEGMGFDLVGEETFDDGFCLLAYELAL
ncbi:MAG: GNAT family N-acetyltransferase [Actinomycetota bacterium]